LQVGSAGLGRQKAPAPPCLAIVGPLDRTSRTAQLFANAGFRIEIFSDRIADEECGRRIGQSDIDHLAAQVRNGRVNRVLIATPVSEHHRLAIILKRLEGVAVDIDLVLDGFSTPSHLRPGVLKDICIARVLRRPLTSTQSLVKSVSDRIGALLLLVILAPLLLSIALIVKLTSPGPILFRQPRFGLNNDVFQVLKFRTLFHHHSDSNAQQPVRRHDQRVTPIGHTLRALSLDELPQLLNVLKGDMSLVGPRPLPVGLKVEGIPCSEYPHYSARHRVRPGITGLAQISGWRGGMEDAGHLEKRLAFDLTYIDNYSLLLDARILIATPLTMLRAKNAY
jgi:exopolysaccharide biosynthesis polyprenyl glycosylphosphotransferase